MRGFTLIELLVVVAITSVLVAVLLPALQTAQEYAGLAACLSNLHQISGATLFYNEDHNGFFPSPGGTSWPMWFYGGDDEGAWVEGRKTGGGYIPVDERPLAPYLDADSGVYRCPGDQETYYGEPYWDTVTASYPFNNLPSTAYPQTLWSARAGQVDWPSITIVVSDLAIGGTRTDANPYVFERPAYWWHPDGFKQKKIAIGFADGHSGYVRIFPYTLNCPTYRISPYDVTP